MDDEVRQYLKFPDSWVTIVVSLAGKVGVAGELGELESGPLEVALCGVHTHAILGQRIGAARGLVVSLAPWAAFRLLGVSMDELADTVLELGDVAEPFGRDLVTLLREKSSWAEIFDLTDALLADRLATGPAFAPQVPRAWRRLTRTAGQVPVAALAAQVGLGERQLESRFREQIGVSPKTVARVLRLRHARTLLGAGSPPATVAANCGYYDQAHLCREFKAMTGYAPSRLPVARDFGFVQDVRLSRRKASCCPRRNEH